MEYNAYVMNTGSEEDIQKRMELFRNLRLWRESVSRKIRLDEDYSSSASYLRSEPLTVVV